MQIPYNKPILNISQQIELLSKRWLIINDLKYAEKHLDLIWYYRLSMYCKFFQIHSFSSWKKIIINKFESWVHFEDIIHLYNFDRKLRLLLWNIVEKIENSFKAFIIDEITNFSGDLFEYINNRTFYDLSLWKHVKSVKDSNNKLFWDPNMMNHKIIRNFKEKYSNPYLPLHMFINLQTFGWVIMYFKKLNPTIKQNIISKFWYNEIIDFINDIQKIKDIRNICHHHDLMFSDFKKVSEIIFKFKNQIFPKSHIDNDIYVHYINNISLKVVLKEAPNNILLKYRNDKFKRIRLICNKFKRLCN